MMGTSAPQGNGRFGLVPNSLTHEGFRVWWGRPISTGGPTGVTVAGGDEPIADGTRRRTAAAGPAFALHCVVTALAGCLVILRGESFNVATTGSPWAASAATSSPRALSGRRLRSWANPQSPAIQR